MTLALRHGLVTPPTSQEIPSEAAGAKTQKPAATATLTTATRATRATTPTVLESGLNIDTMSSASKPQKEAQNKADAKTAPPAWYEHTATMLMESPTLFGSLSRSVKTLSAEYDNIAPMLKETISDRLHSGLKALIQDVAFPESYDGNYLKPDIEAAQKLLEPGSSQTSGVYLAPIPAHVEKQLDPAALQNQKDLVRARILVGEAEELTKAYPDDKSLQIKFAGAKNLLKTLEKKEASLPKVEVERARLPVFISRLSVLEEQHGSAAASQMARQTYYNHGFWPLISGAPPISDAKVNIIGLPHGPYASGVTDGYDGEMRTLDGSVVDIGHLPCAIDFHLNKDRVPESFYGIPSAFDTYAVTMTGDMASAVLNFKVGHEKDPDMSVEKMASRSILIEGSSDLRGDIDALVIVSQLKQNPNASLAELLQNHYQNESNPGYKNRMIAFVDNDPLLERAEDGTIRVTTLEDGSVPFHDKLQDVTMLTSKLGFGWTEEDREMVPTVVGAMVDWMNREKNGENGTDNKKVSLDPAMLFLDR